MKMLAVDLGRVRTGIAVCDPLEMLAFPVCVIKQSNLNRILDEVAAIAAAEKVQKIVMGHPKNMDATAGESAKRAEKAARLLADLTGLEVVLWDERSTTVLAQRLLQETETFGQKRKKAIDTVAATLILESYMSFRRLAQGREEK